MVNRTIGSAIDGGGGEGVGGAGGGAANSLGFSRLSIVDLELILGKRKSREDIVLEICIVRRAGSSLDATKEQNKRCTKERKSMGTAEV